MHHYGQVFRELRKNKKYSLKQIAGPEVSIAQVSRFERGESELSLAKFIYALDKLQISMEDFMAIVRQYKNGVVLRFMERFNNSEDSYDLNDLKKWRKEEEAKLEKFPDDTYFKLNNIILAALMGQIREWYQPSDDDLTYASDYLLSTEDWGNYEFLLSNSLYPYLEVSLVKKLGRMILDRKELYDYILSQKRQMTMTLLNVYKHCLQHKDSDGADEFKKALRKLLADERLVTERMLFHYLKGFAAHLDGKKSGKKQMKHILEVWRHIDLDDLYDQYRAHYKRFTDD